MAWNTDLRCRRMGADGQGLAMIATEIRNFSNHLEMLTNGIAGTFQQLVDAAAEMRDQAEEAGKVDADRALSASLDCVRDGGRRMGEGMSGLDRDAAAVGDILRQTTENVDCDAEIGDALGEAVLQLASSAGEAVLAPEEPPAALGEILNVIFASYTMASERDIHKRFALAVAGSDEEVVVECGDDDDDDDGLF
jgi:methyl-accepting chemotaxis protein